jgi:hypothetical protein
MTKAVIWWVLIQSIGDVLTVWVAGLVNVLQILLCKTIKTWEN